MTEKEITIAGKKVNIGYCYATELAFNNYTGKSIENFDATKPEHVMYLILSAEVCWYHAHDQKLPIKDEDLMYQVSPKELIDAVTAIFSMRSEWYQLPDGEDKKGNDEEASGEDSEKN